MVVARGPRGPRRLGPGLFGRCRGAARARGRGELGVLAERGGLSYDELTVLPRSQDGISWLFFEGP